MSDDLVHDLGTNPVHLGLGAVAQAMPVFDGTMEWYQSYGERTAADGAEGRLVAMHTFTAPWDTWEMHPNGDELVVCISGEMTLHQETAAGEARTVTLGPGQYVVNEPGTWHTADIEDRAVGLFVTAGLGTEIRPR